MATPDATVQPEQAQAPAARPYDFRRPQHLSPDQMKTVQRIHAAAADALQLRLSRYLGINLDARFESTGESSYALLAESLAPNTYINVLDMAPLPDRGMLLLDAKLCLAFVDRALGGPCRSVAADRPLTAVDQVAVEAAIELLLKPIREAWQDFIKLRLAVTERRTDIHQIQSFSATEVMLVISSVIKADFGEMRFRLCIPVPSLKAALDGALLKGGLRATPERAEQVRQALMDSLDRTPLPMTATLGTADVPLENLLRLQAGDILRLDQHAQSPILLHVGARPTFLARTGLRGRRKAVQISARLDNLQED